jgi:hypothetical protein
MANVDFFSIEIMKDPNLIGYIVIYSGKDTCRGEAQAHAERMKDYLMQVRRVPWDKVMWRDVGRFSGKGLDVLHVVLQREQLADATVQYQYEAPPKGHTIPECRRRTRK